MHVQNEPYLVQSANRISLAGERVERVFLARLQSARQIKDFAFPLAQGRVPTQWKRNESSSASSCYIVSFGGRRE